MCRLSTELRKFADPNDGWSAKWPSIPRPSSIHKYRRGFLRALSCEARPQPCETLWCSVHMSGHSRRTHRDGRVLGYWRLCECSDEIHRSPWPSQIYEIRQRYELCRSWAWTSWGHSRWNQSKISSFLLQRSIDWTFNMPAASHHGGSWERLIRSIRRILAGLLKEQTLTDDGLRTLLSEVESILNSHPLTRSSSDPNDLSCLTPIHLLLLKDQPSLPIGAFVKEDNYVRRRWRQVQYLSDLFWKRWVCEYLPFLQERQKWLFPQRNVQLGDIVLVVDPSAPRGSWPLGKVQAVFPDGSGWVRSAEVKTMASTLARPVTKLVIVLECDN